MICQLFSFQIMEEEMTVSNVFQASVLPNGNTFFFKPNQTKPNETKPNHGHKLIQNLRSIQLRNASWFGVLRQVMDASGGKVCLLFQLPKCIRNLMELARHIINHFFSIITK